jgi:hypothetical protein
MERAKLFGMQQMNRQTVRVQLDRAGVTRLDLVNLHGRVVGTFLQGYQSEGSMDIPMGAMQRGVYLLRLVQGNYSQTMKFINP